MSYQTCKKVSIVIPALNERDGIAATIQAIPKSELEKMGYSVQILVVDNGSTDDTGEIAKNAGADVVYEPKRGYGCAYKTGFAHAEGDIIATTDADLTYPVEDIPEMVKYLVDENLDFITTNRYNAMEKDAMSPLHRLGNFILTLSTRLLFQIKIRDSQSGMWVFNRPCLENAILRSNSMSFSEEIKIEAFYYLKNRCEEMPIKYRKRLGKVKLNTWKHGFSNLCYLFKKRLIR